MHLHKLLAGLFIVIVPMLLITSTVRWAFNSASIYEVGFVRHNVSSTTGLSDSQLSKAGKEIREYFSSNDDRLHIPIYSGSTEMELFTPIETQHMLDVKRIVQKLNRIQEGLLLFVLLFITAGFLLRGPEFAGLIRRLVRYGSISTISLMVLAGISVTVAFDPLFTLFHKISFANDYWLLDPRTSFLVRMFPLDFWFETTMFIGFLCVIEAALMVFTMIFLGWWKRRKQVLADRRVTRYI